MRILVSKKVVFCEQQRKTIKRSKCNNDAGFNQQNQLILNKKCAQKTDFLKTGN